MEVVLMHRVCCHHKQASKISVFLVERLWLSCSSLCFDSLQSPSPKLQVALVEVLFLAHALSLHSVCQLCELKSPAWAATDSKASAFSPSQPANVMELMFAEWEDGERFSFEDSDRFEEDSLCSFISEAESLCQNWRGWRKQSAGPNSPTVKIKGNRVHPDVLWNSPCLSSHCHRNMIPVTPLCPCSYLWP